MSASALDRAIPWSSLGHEPYETRLRGPSGCGEAGTAANAGHASPGILLSPCDPARSASGHCCVGRSRMAGDWSSDCTSRDLGLRWLPVPAGGDLGRRPVVPPVWAVLSGCRGVAGRVRCHRGPRQHLPVGAAVRPGVHRNGQAVPLYPGDWWFVDETYVKVAGRWTYLYRAVDQHGQVIGRPAFESAGPGSLSAAHHGAVCKQSH